MATGNEGDGGSWAIAIAVCAVFVNVIVFIVGGIWTLARSGRDTDEKIATKDLAVTQEFANLERRMNETVDKAVHDFGETVTALRTKVTETELWNRDNFVSKLTFQTATDDLKRSWERFEDNINERFDRLDKKFDRTNMTS